MKNILLLGGNGFLGKNFIEKSLTQDCFIILLNRKQEAIDIEFMTDHNIKVVEGELCEIELIKNLIIDYAIDVVIHLVSTLIPSSTLEDFHDDMVSVIHPTFKLIDFLTLTEVQFIFFSSGGTIYGKSNKPLAESHKLSPINYYGYSKLMIEQYIQYKRRISGLKYLIIRPSNIFGPHQRLNNKQGFIAVATKKILEQQEIEIWGDGKTIRDYLQVSDLIDALYNILKINLSEEIINIGSGQGHDLLEIIFIVENILNKKANILFRDKRAVDVEFMVLNIEKLKSLINFTPMSINTGIQKFIQTLQL